MRGVPLSWELVVATIYLKHHRPKPTVIWSPCSKFIAVAAEESVKVLYAETLNRLATFNHPLLSEDSYLSFSPDSHSLAVLADWKVSSWDLQTGGRLSEIHAEFPQQSVGSFTHSKDGKMVAVACGYEHFRRKVYTFDLHSRSRLGPLIVSDGKLITPIWTHNKYIRFATINRGSITIQEVEFTLKHPPTQIESLPIPDEVIDGSDFLLFPALSRLAFTLEDTIQVWDFKASRLLLLESAAKNSFGSPSAYSFSSDSHFFAFVTAACEVHVLKDSPVGYVLYQKFPPLPKDLEWLHLSPNGRSIVFPLNDTINLWHTVNQIPFPPSSLTEAHSQHHFILTFSPDKKFVAFAQSTGNLVTILDLQSGNLQLTIDTGMQVECLGVAGDTVIVVDKRKIVTWNLPGGDCAFNAGINNSVRTVMLDCSPLPGGPFQALSPDLSFIMAEVESEWVSGLRLEIYDVPTGMRLASATSHWLSLLWFTQDGHEVWMFSSSEKWGWEIIKGDKSGSMELKPLEETSCPSGMFLWQSHHGYEVTDDGWVLSPTQKRLLWLPHRWREDRKEYRLWSGRFLGLSHKLSEVVILEFLE